MEDNIIIPSPEELDAFFFAKEAKTAVDMLNVLNMLAICADMRSDIEVVQGKIRERFNLPR